MWSSCSIGWNAAWCAWRVLIGSALGGVGVVAAGVLATVLKIYLG